MGSGPATKAPARAAFALACLVAACAHGPRAGAQHDPTLPGTADQASASPSTAGPDGGPPPLVRFVGRVAASGDTPPRFSWPGTQAVTRFAGTSLHVHVREAGYDELQVVVDGNPVGVVSTNPQREDYLVVAGLDGGVHDLVLSKRTEARMGELSFLGFEPRAALAPPPPPADRRVELVGDSITAGYGSEGGGPACTGNVVALENEYLSYGAIASRAVGAEHVTIAWAGRTTEEMSALYERAVATRAGSTWDFARWTPDAVVVNLGTNDFNRGDPGAAAFTRPYRAFLERLRARYPRALLVCALGTMLTDGYPPGAHALTRARAYIASVVAALRAAGDTRVTFLEFAPRSPADGLGCDYHPSLKTHRAMGDQLARTLKEELGW